MALSLAAISVQGQNNSLLKRARKVTTFTKEEREIWFGYAWLSNTEIVFQRGGGYVRRNVVTGKEEDVKGCPRQDKTHWFGGNLGAQTTPDGVWMLYHGRRGNEYWDDGSLRADRVDGSANLTWPARQFPEVAAQLAFWLADNETWACPTSWQDSHARWVSGVVTGSVRAPGKVRRIPYARGVGEDWEIIGSGRDRLFAQRMPEERKPPAASSTTVAELILGDKVTRGASWTLRFAKRVHASTESDMSREGRMLWSLVVRGNPWYGERPLWTVLSVWQPGEGLRELGRLTTTKDDWDDEPFRVRWLPDGRRFSFLYRRVLYVVSIDGR